MPAVSDLQLEPHQAVEGDERAEIRITMPHLPSTGGTRGSDCLQALLLGRGGPGVASSHGKSPGPMNARAPYADSPLVYSSHFCFPRNFLKGDAWGLRGARACSTSPDRSVSDVRARMIASVVRGRPREIEPLARHRQPIRVKAGAAGNRVGPCAATKSTKSLIMSNMGRYMATTMPPITTPITMIMMGSRIEVSAVTAAATSSS